MDLNDAKFQSVPAELAAVLSRFERVALAFSGGVDSAYLLHAALAQGLDVKAYYVASVFQPAFEREDARRLVAELGAEMEVLELDVLSSPAVSSNSPERCYWCKRAIMGAVQEAARADGRTVLFDGSNASDDVADRPGMRALVELEVHSPLREAGLTKARIRELSRRAGLFTWDKPAYACLATRIPTGREITPQLLERVERAESAMFAMGLRDFRVRVMGEAARIEVTADELPLLLERREEIVARLGEDFAAVLLDLRFREGSG
ncbi:MAG: ATP-dependent sacrificial sulfur transferase LarE [Bacillota bacterium]|nr:ATP-dependent sacrificial sulfur transferase LarE [Bacillota bacterium]